MMEAGSDEEGEIIGIYFGAIDDDSETLSSEAQAMLSDRKEMASVTAELRIRRALASKVPRNADQVIGTGGKLRLASETDRRYLRSNMKEIFVLEKQRRVETTGKKIR